MFPPVREQRRRPRLITTRERAIVLALLLLALTAYPRDAWCQLGPGDPAPDFTLPDIHDTPFTLSAFRGRVVLLALIGYGCTPCLQAAPAVERIWQDFKGTGAFQVLALDMWNGTVAQVQVFVDRTGVTYPVLRNAGFLQTSYGIRFDSYVVIDPKGMIRYTSLNETSGSFNDAALRDAIATHLPGPVTWAAIKELYR